eukprot:COSAG01_NODE_581_length_15195_cov_16.315291_12_plen_92_part_00
MPASRAHSSFVSCWFALSACRPDGRTDAEFQDNHTRSVCLRGGSNYRSAGSHWYFPNEADLLTHNKYFLMNPRYERAGTVGFRCVADARKE